MKPNRMAKWIREITILNIEYGRINDLKRLESRGVDRK